MDANTDRSGHFLILLLQIIALFPSVWTDGNMCGTATPDPMKTCISVRLPWQPEPLYFCMEKEKFRYRNQCYPGGNNCKGGGMMDMARNDTLIIATPWDCCPYTSVPDHCMTQHCPPPPMGRMCKEVGLMMGSGAYGNSWNNGDCCPKYWCEDGVTPENCGMKRLDPMCVNPPQGKMNCVGFHDLHGCCTKYQCDGEGKPGLCPLQHQAMQIRMRMNSTHMHMMNMTIMHPGVASKSLEPEASPIQMNMRTTMNIGGGIMSMGPISCINDNNCAGGMKCCSSDMSVYGDGKFMMKNVNPTHGSCTEPVMMAPIMS